MSSAYIKQLRAPFAKELKNTATANLVCAMMYTEDAAHPLPVIESLFNRTCYVNSHGQHKTLAQMITGGFYGPYNRGQYPNALRHIASSKILQARLNDAIDEALAGSNTIQGYTDQGLPTDPNGWRKPQMHLGGNVFNDWAGGPGGAAAAEVWRQDFLAKASNTIKLEDGTELSPAGYPVAQEKTDTSGDYTIAANAILKVLDDYVNKFVPDFMGYRTQALAAMPKVAGTAAKAAVDALAANHAKNK